MELALATPRAKTNSQEAQFDDLIRYRTDHPACSITERVPSTDLLGRGLPRAALNSRSR